MSLPGLKVLAFLMLAASTASLTACVSVPASSTAQPQAAASSAILRGTLLLPPGAQLPQGARLQLALIDRFGQSGQLAAREIALSGDPPIGFELPFSRGRVADITVYRLDASIFDSSGRLMFTSDGEHPVNLGVEAEPTRIELMAISSERRSARRFNCEGLPLNAEFLDPELRIEISNQQHNLRRAHAASGARYIGANAEFWTKGSEARLQLGDRGLSCELIAE